LFYCIQASNIQQQVERATNTGSQRNIGIDSLKKLTIFYPIQNEQKQIGQYFQKLDKLINQKQAKYEKLQKLKKAMLEKMFSKNGSDVPEIRFKGFDGSWEEKTLAEVAKYRNGKAHENDINDKGEYIVVNSKFVSTNGARKKFSNNQIEPLHKNEITFVLSDVPNGRAIARTFLVDKDDKYTLNQRIAGITPFEYTFPYYLYILLNRNSYFLQFDDGVKQTNLSKNDVETFKSYYPSPSEQEKIGNYFKNLDELITLNQKELEKLKTIKKACLEKMFV
jgi:type I restriction enzyme S subunit